MFSLWLNFYSQSKFSIYNQVYVELIVYVAGRINGHCVVLIGVYRYKARAGMSLCCTSYVSRLSSFMLIKTRSILHDKRDTVVTVC